MGSKQEMKQELRLFVENNNNVPEEAVEKSLIAICPLNV